MEMKPHNFCPPFRCPHCEFWLMERGPNRKHALCVNPYCPRAATVSYPDYRQEIEQAAKRKGLL